MKLVTLLLPLTILLSISAHGEDGGGHGGHNTMDFGNHQAGTGNLIENIYMHTLGHFITDFPKYLIELAKTGDIFGFLLTLIKFVLYHNPVNLLQDFGGGPIN